MLSLSSLLKVMLVPAARLARVAMTSVVQSTSQLAVHSVLLLHTPFSVLEWWKRAVDAVFQMVGAG